MYEAYMWEGFQSFEDDWTPMKRHKVSDATRLRDEDRLFEDPLYLMEYTISWESTYAAGGSLQSPENDAFINAENVVYLKKVATVQ